MVMIDWLTLGCERMWYQAKRAERVELPDRAGGRVYPARVLRPAPLPAHPVGGVR